MGERSLRGGASELGRKKFVEVDGTSKSVIYSWASLMNTAGVRGSWCFSGALIVGGEESLRKLTRFEKTVHNRRLRWNGFSGLRRKLRVAKRSWWEAKKELKSLVGL